MPSGYETGLDSSNPSGTDTVLRIEKPIYGMAQTGRRWQRTIFPFTLRWGPPEEVPVGGEGCWQMPTRNVKMAGAPLVVEYM